MNREPVQLDYAHPDNVDRAGWRRTLPYLLIGGWGVTVIGWGLIVFGEVETVLISGPVLAICGVLLVIAGWRLRLRAASWLGLSHCMVFVLFVTLVNLFDWSPNEAHWPFLIMAGIYAAGTTSAMIVWREPIGLSAVLRI